MCNWGMRSDASWCDLSGWAYPLGVYGHLSANRETTDQLVSFNGPGGGYEWQAASGEVFLNYAFFARLFIVLRSLSHYITSARLGGRGTT